MGIRTSLAELGARMQERRARRRRGWTLDELDGMSAERLRDIGVWRDQGGHYWPR